MVNSMTYFYFDSVYDLFVGDYTDPNDGSTMKFNSISDLETVWKVSYHIPHGHLDAMQLIQSTIWEMSKGSSPYLPTLGSNNIFVL